MPRISIGMPVYQGGNYLRAALDSILAQTYKDFELVISDNGSTDSTPLICREYAARDPRIRYYRNESNSGAGWNHRRVAELATGEYYKWASHDDLIAPDFLEKCVSALDRDPTVVLVYAKTLFIDENGAPAGTYDPDTVGFDSNKPHVRFGVRTSRIRPPYPFLPRRLEDAHAIFGLMRLAALRSIPPFGDYGASDQLILAQLALIGRFHRLPEYLFLNRDHASRSVRAFCGRRRQTFWLNPSKQEGIVFPEWRIVQEFASSIARGPISRFERLLCYWKFGGYIFWNWPRLARDLLLAGRQWSAGLFSKDGVTAIERS